MSIESMMPSNHLVLCHSSSSCPQSFPASGSFLMSQFFASGSQSIGASTSVSVLPINIQGWFPLALTGLIFLLFKDSQEFYPALQFKSINFLALSKSIYLGKRLRVGKSRVWLFATLWTVAHQASLSMGFSRKEYWSGLPCPSPKAWRLPYKQRVK